MNTEEAGACNLPSPDREVVSEKFVDAVLTGHAYRWRRHTADEHRAPRPDGDGSDTAAVWWWVVLIALMALYCVWRWRNEQ